jgi:hypothetical protein
VALAVLLTPRPASSYTLEQLLRGRLDPALEYRTLGTPHFWIHHPRELEDLAGEVARLAEDAHDRVTTVLGTAPGEKTHIVLVQRSDQPNTFTFVHPHPQIFLDVALPHLGMGMNDHADWYDAVPVAATGRRLRSLAGSLGLHVPLGAEHSSFWLQPRVGAEQRTDVVRSLYLSTGVELDSDTQFRQLGYSFHESGSLLRVGSRVLWDLERAGEPLGPQFWSDVCWAL